MSKLENKLRESVVLPLWPDVGQVLGQVLGLGRNSTYSAAERGDIETIRFGRLKRVPTSWLRKKLGIRERDTGA